VALPANPLGRCVRRLAAVDDFEGEQAASRSTRRCDLVAPRTFPEAQVLNPESQILNLQSGILNLEFRIWNPEF
jgi:hypothetical protein